MKFIYVLIAAVGAQAVSNPNLILGTDIFPLASREELPPTKREISNASEARLMNYALALENIQNSFYSQGLANFTDADFAAAGLPPSARGRFVQIGQQEEAHVAILSVALGSNATQPCNYTFPVTDVKSFVAAAQVLESIGTSAYTGVIQNLTSPNLIVVSSSILSDEARHAAWVASVINNMSPWSVAFDTPLSPDQTWTLAGPLIVTCPESNQPLGLDAFPPLNVTTGFPDSNVTFSFDASFAISKANATGSTENIQLFASFLSGLTKEFRPIFGSDDSLISINGTTGGGENTTIPGNTTASGNPIQGKVLLPQDLRGVVYAVVTNNEMQATDETIVAGPTVLIFDFDSGGNVTSAMNLTTVGQPNVTTGEANLTIPSVTTTLDVSTITVGV